MNQSDIDRFWSKVDVRGPEECWEWQAGRFNHGYGMFGLKGKALLAHRIAFVLVKGAIHPGLHILHSCDNRGCCNPNHLREGTNLDNVNDKVSKGRQSRLSGEDHGRARLSATEVADIRSLYAEGGITQLELARRYSISKSHVSAILTHRLRRLG